MSVMHTHVPWERHLGPDSFSQVVSSGCTRLGFDDTWCVWDWVMKNREENKENLLN